MSFSKSMTLLLVCLMASLMVACVSPPEAQVDYNRSYDFSSVRKIALQPIDRTAASTVIISDMQIDRINAAVREELQRRGLVVVADNADADMLLAWHLVTQERTDVRNFNTSAGYNCWNCGIGGGFSVRQYTQGTFIVDMIDPIKLRSVWRSTFESRMRTQTDPAKAAATREAAAQAIFVGFPPN